jgi:uncharacterized membrane protein YphA (DoxX/SURF4 family)
MIASALNRIVSTIERAPSNMVNATGVISAGAGIYSWMGHATTILGLLTAFVAFLGASFYAGYWFVKMVKEWKHRNDPVEG